MFFLELRCTAEEGSTVTPERCSDETDSKHIKQCLLQPVTCQYLLLSLWYWSGHELPAPTPPAHRLHAGLSSGQWDV
ncbi:uncharacterized protein [Nothobranchius furzeri]|uniref:uncharacterized protein isoform X2 n=1 Tax=Nothobranchius furzeri TaxID=105023 RepID=UPI00390468EB